MKSNSHVNYYIIPNFFSIYTHYIVYYIYFTIFRALFMFILKNTGLPRWH